MMHRTHLSIALCAALAATAALACGPDFPNELLADRAQTLAHLPEAAFAVEVSRLLPNTEPLWLPMESGDYWDPVAALQAQREAAEDADLSADERATVAIMRAAPNAAAAYTAGAALAEDLRAYVAGAVGYRNGEFAVARDYFQASIAADSTPQARRVVWAQYMLGESFASLADPEAAAASYAAARAAVSAGAPDPLGLAVASLGQEARLYLDAAPQRALALYVAQAATGSVSGANSTLFLARRAFADPLRLSAWVEDPLARRVAVAYAFSRAGELAVDEPTLQDAAMGDVDPYRVGEASAIARLLDAIEQLPDAEVQGVDRLAAVAYRAGRFGLATRLVAKDRSPLSAWVRAKLALRSGDRDGAATAYAEAAKAFPADEHWLSVGSSTGMAGDVHPQCQVNAERGVLALARGDYVEAMAALYAAGPNYWMDTQYVAERVLTVDELVAFVAQNPAPTSSTEGDPDGGEDNLVQDQRSMLSELLARRLMRASRFDDAAHYFVDEANRSHAAAYAAALRSARNDWFVFDRVGRAEAWFQAAQIAREHGMDIFGMEGQPDFKVFGGSYGRDPGHYDAEYNWIAEPASDIALSGEFIGMDETARLSASAPAHLSRFHYRQVAADHAMQAANFVPARSQAFAAMLCTGTRWLINREPEAAQVLYRRYVAEGALVPFGATFGAVCPAPEFDRARDRAGFERWRGIKTALRAYGGHAAAGFVLLLGALWWRRSKRAPER